MLRPPPIVFTTVVCNNSNICTINGKLKLSCNRQIMGVFETKKTEIQCRDTFKENVSPSSLHKSSWQKRSAARAPPLSHVHSCVTRIGHFELFVQRGPLGIFQTNAEHRTKTVERIARKTFHPFLPSLWVHRDADLAVCYLRERRISVGLSVYLDMAYTGVWRLWKSSKTNGDHQAKPRPRIDSSGAGFCIEIDVLIRVRIVCGTCSDQNGLERQLENKKWRETIVS